MIDPKLLTLLKVVELGSFTGAAGALSITQPAVSQHIRALEDELGVRIFERQNGRLLVTRQGEKVIQCARKIVTLYANLRQSLEDSGGRGTHLTIGVTHTAESNPIAEALAQYCAEHEGISIKMITDSISNLYKMLKNYELDLAIVEGRVTDPGLQYLMLDTDYLVLVAPVGHPLARRSMVTLGELKKERMILRLPDSNTRKLFEAGLESNGLSLGDFNVVLEVDNVATIKDLVRRDFGVSVLGRSVCLDDLKKGRLAVLPIQGLSMMREVNIAYTEDFTRLDMLKDIAAIYNDTLHIYA